MDWLAVAAWIGLLVLSGLAFREDRRNHREPAFIPPSSPGGAETGMSASQRPYAQVGDSADDDVFADKYEAGAPPVQPAPYGYGRPNVLAQQDASSAMARPSVDAYGAFDGDMPGARVPVPGYEPSRTMQMAAYSDPCKYCSSSALSLLLTHHRRRRARPGAFGRWLRPPNPSSSADGLPHTRTWPACPLPPGLLSSSRVSQHHTSVLHLCTLS